MPRGNPGPLVRAAAAVLLAAAACLPAALELAEPAPATVIGPPAALTGDRAVPPRDPRHRPEPPTGAAPTVDIRHSGPTANRITLVLLGDGYTTAEQDVFRDEAERTWRSLMEIEPFRTYQGYFNIRRVEIVSPSSGIAEGDRARPGSPLGMHFFCEGTPRLLCADETATARYAGEGGGPQFLIALANSAEYGGAGGTGVTTLAGGSPEAGRIIQHEMGHTVGDLGDEYDSAPADAGYPNLATVGADEMRRSRAKWWRWLGAQSPEGGGTVGAYRSGNGLYRPTQDSVMRTLGGGYNPPSREAIIEQIYRRVRPADPPDPPSGAVAGRPRLQVHPLPLSGARRLRVDWAVDGVPVEPAVPDRDWLDTAALPIAPGHRATVTATVRDTTDWVRDETYRDRYLTMTTSWTVTG